MCSEYVDDGKFKIIKCVIICNKTGTYLVGQTFDPKLNGMMLSSFISAVSMFGNECMGSLDEISIKGLDIDMIVIQKYDLVLIAVMDKGFCDDVIKNRAEDLLDAFFLAYRDELLKPCETHQFEGFEEVLCSRIKSLLEATNDRKLSDDYHFDPNRTSVSERAQ